MGSNRRSGFTLIELMIVVTILGILAALGVPFLLSARASANESSAIGSLRAINTSEANYATTCAGGAFAVNLPYLISQAFLSPDMGFNPKSGFNFAVRAGATSQPGPADCTGVATVTAYYASGRPVSATSGRRAFATNAAGTVWQDTTGIPPTEPFTAGANVSTIQ